MAKKNLINADMLLAKPRTVAEPQPTVVAETPQITETDVPKTEEKVAPQATEIPQDTPTEAKVTAKTATKKATVAPKVEETPTPPVVEPPLSNAPETAETEATSSTKKGLSASEIRATFIVTEHILEKIKAIAYWERLNIKEVVQDALEDFINAYEKKNGTIKNVPATRQK